MSRSAVVVAVLFAMLWQSMALARVGSTADAVADQEHAMLHWKDTGHHHHDDGSYQLDDSNESVLHVATGDLSASPGVSVSWHGVPQPGSSSPESPGRAGLPNPALDGLLRPPRPRPRS